MATIFLHGLESSSNGTKATWFRAHFPDMLIPDFTGGLDNRLHQLESVLSGKERLVLVGSSFGGLMASLFTMANESRVKKVILLAPALNFPEFSKYPVRTVTVPAWIYIGNRDTVCPPAEVVPAARKIFANLSVQESDDDHLLRSTFYSIDWVTLLAE